MAKCPIYQPSGAGGTSSPPATPHLFKNPKWPTLGFGCSRQVSLHRFFELNIPSMRTHDDGGDYVDEKLFLIQAILSC